MKNFKLLFLKKINLIAVNRFPFLGVFFLSLFFFISCSPDSQSDAILEANARILSEPGQPELFLSGLQGASGSTIGPGGDLFVTEGAIGRISRINLKTGEMSTFAEGLPPSIPSIGIGGPTDLVFIDDTAYVLVTLVNFGPNSSPEVGIYRIDGPDSYTVIADIGTFTTNHLNVDFGIFVPTGVQYAIDTYQGGFIVTDGHLNRVLYITMEGDISIMRQFGNIVPTGLEVSGNTIYMAEAGPTPHNPSDGKIISFNDRSDETSFVASGAPLLVDVEMGRGRTMFGLAQGEWSGGDPGSPADPNTGSLVKVNGDSFETITTGLNLPTSMQIVKNTAYIITLTGDIWMIPNISDAPFGV